MDDTNALAITPDVETPSAAPSTPGKRPMEMNEAEFYDWKLTGKRPSAEPVESSDDEALAPTSEPAAPVDVAPAATPAPSKPISKRQQQINDYERKVAELSAENARLKAFDTMRTSAAPRPAPRPAPAQTPPTADSLIARPDISRGPLSEQEFFQQFPEAPYSYHGAYLARYFQAQEHAEGQQRSHIEAASRAFETQTTTFQSRVAAVPTFNLAASPSAQSCYPGTPMGDVILESEHPVELFQHFDAHPAELQRIRALSAREQIREMGRLEARFERPAATRPAQTSAPDPPITLGTRTTDPADPVRSAIKRRDFSTYKELANERDLARTHR